MRFLGLRPWPPSAKNTQQIRTKRISSISVDLLVPIEGLGPSKVVLVVTTRLHVLLLNIFKTLPWQICFKSQPITFNKVWPNDC